MCTNSCAQFYISLILFNNYFNSSIVSYGWLPDNEQTQNNM